MFHPIAVPIDIIDDGCLICEGERETRLIIDRRVSYYCTVQVVHLYMDSTCIYNMCYNTICTLLYIQYCDNIKNGNHPSSLALFLPLSLSWRWRSTQHDDGKCSPYARLITVPDACYSTRNVQHNSTVIIVGSKYNRRQSFSALPWPPNYSPRGGSLLFSLSSVVL